MRNKKYRIWKSVILMLVLSVAFFIVSSLVAEKWEKIVMLAGGIFSIVVIPTILPQFFEVQDDRIIARGTNSLNKKYDRSFTKCVFMFDDIEDITVEDNKAIWIRLKDGNNVTVVLGGFFKKQEIISLVYEVRAQIKCYEQVYVNKD